MKYFSKIILPLKITLAIALIYWTYREGMWDVEFLKLAFINWQKFYASIFIALFINALVALRWRNLLLAASPGIEKVSRWRFVNVVYISSFFNTFIPGAITGDVLRFQYSQYLSPLLKKRTIIISSFIDRITGLVAMIFAGSVAAWILSFNVFATNLGEMTTSMHITLNILRLMLMIPIILLIIIFAPSNWIDKPLTYIYRHTHNITQKFFPFGLQEILHSIHVYRRCLFKNFSLSIFLQSFTFILLFLWTDVPLDLAHLDKIILTIAATSIGLVSLAIPLSPSGAGVGHLVFGTIFDQLGLNNGANIFNIYFIMTLIMNLVGIIPFLIIKKPEKKSTNH